MFKVAVVGATGAVGKELLSILRDRKFPIKELVPFASARSEGKQVEFGGRSYGCQTLKKGCFEGVDIAFFDASDAISKEWVPHAAESGAWVVDNSATFRMDDDVLLLVPEVNGALLEARLKNGAKNLSPRERILTGPNCSTVQMVMALKPLRDHWGIQRVVVSTYQSTSGAGAAAMEELSAQLRDVLGGKPAAPKAFTHQIAFNCIPHIGGFKDDAYTSEEHKMMAESRKILGLPGLRLSATAVRVPTLSSHSESINVECERPIDLEKYRSVLSSMPGVIVQDEPKKNVYPMSMTHAGDVVEAASGRDAVYVGRIRKDPPLDNGLNLWVVSDNLRKGAALNAVQIGEMVLKTLG
jgi:aspartate-semialdehyde dehydrogenase